MNNEIEFTPSPDFRPLAPMAHAEKRAALRAKRDAKVKAYRIAQKIRKDGWTEPEERHASALRVIRSVIRRVQLPRHGEPVFLSATDRADAEAAGMLAIVQTGFFEKGFITLRTFRAVRNAIQGPDCLRMRRNWETCVASPADVAAANGFATEFEEFAPRLSPAQKGMAKEIFRTLRAALGADSSRKAKAAFQGHREFFLIVLGELTGRRARAMSPDTFRQRALRFRNYLASGASALRATRKPARLSVELLESISGALAARAFA